MLILLELLSYKESAFHSYFSYGDRAGCKTPFACSHGREEQDPSYTLVRCGVNPQILTAPAVRTGGGSPERKLTGRRMGRDAVMGAWAIPVRRCPAQFHPQRAGDLYR